MKILCCYRVSASYSDEKEPISVSSNASTLIYSDQSKKTNSYEKSLASINRSIALFHHNNSCDNESDIVDTNSFLSSRAEEDNLEKMKQELFKHRKNLS